MLISQVTFGHTFVHIWQIQVHGWIQHDLIGVGGGGGFAISSDCIQLIQ